MDEKHRILIIEDDPGIIELLEVVLESGQYHTIPAQGGTKGLRLLRESGADLVLLDLMMDDVDGWSVLQEINADEAIRDVPIIILTVRSAWEDPDYAAACAGMYVDYIVKPFSVHDLLTRIERVLSNHRPQIPNR
ncbi:MAG: response regulator [Anaerolineae bacterium]|nr:response regulator [Anaerolineae bacterium]